jgi:hypothetical protein
MQRESPERQVNLLPNDCVSLEAWVNTFRETNDTLRKISVTMRGRTAVHLVRSI